jgi:hypothetical protein
MATFTIEIEEIVDENYIPPNGNDPMNIKLACGHYTTNTYMVQLERQTSFSNNPDNRNIRISFVCGCCRAVVARPFSYHSIINYHGFNNWVAQCGDPNYTYY